jgi:hypothetical protein
VKSRPVNFDSDLLMLHPFATVVAGAAAVVRWQVVALPRSVLQLCGGERARWAVALARQKGLPATALDPKPNGANATATLPGAAAVATAVAGAGARV